MEEFSKFLYHAQLEDEIRNSVSVDTYKMLNLPLITYPTVYQGLPKCKNPGSLDKFFIKKEFSDIKTLRKRFIDKAILCLYRNAPLKKKNHIIILTHVLPDGLGDLYAQKTTYTILKKLFPNYVFTLITFIHKKDSFVPKNTEDHWCVYSYSSPKDLEIDNLDEALFKTLRNASVVLQIPTYFKEFDSLIERVYKEKSNKPFPIFESVGEYGFINSMDFHPETKTRCLGLHFLEKGLFLDPDLEKKVKDHPIPEKLDLLIFKGSDLHTYRKTKRLFVAYLYTEEGYYSYLTLIFSLFKKDTKNIDILAIDIKKFIIALEHLMKKTKMLNNTGVSKIELYVDHNYCPIQIKEKGKIVRIIHAGFLKHECFTKLLFLSENPVGIRGNLSLTESISLNKFFFYNIREHNETLYNGLLSLAEKIAPKTYQYLKLSNKKGASIEELSKCFKEAYYDFPVLNKHLLENYNATYHLENLIFRSLCHYENKNIKSYEENLVEEFSEKKETFVNLITKVRSKIKKQS